MTSNFTSALVSSIEEINSTRHYWFVRTQGGDYYSEYLSDGFIAIGYNKIKPEDVAKYTMFTPDGKNLLTEILKEKYPDEQRPGYIGNQLIDFVYNIKKGDIVVIPSYSSNMIAIGEVLETQIFTLSREVDSHACYFEKRKKVKWLKKNQLFSRLDPNLYKLKFAHRTVSRIDPYLGAILDRTISPLFIKNENAHLALEVTQERSLSVVELFGTWIELFELAEEFGKEEGYDIKKEDFDVRINVQSPGTIEFISYAVVGIGVLSILVAGIIGAHIKVDKSIFGVKLNVDLKSDGLIQKVSNFLDKRKDRKLKQQLIDNVNKMQINPEDIVKILEQLNKGEESNKN